MGARVAVTTGSGRTLYDWHVTGEGLVSDQTHVLTFGLGRESEIARVEVRYPDGRMETVDDPIVDSILDLGSDSSSTKPPGGRAGDLP
jgi:hypothetical protein